MRKNSAWVGARPLAACAISAVLLGGLQGPPAEAAAPPAQPPCDTSATTNAEARSLAKRCGQDVEVMDARSEWSTLYAQPDGQMHLQTSIQAVRTKVSGHWTSVDTSLVAGPQGVSMVAPAVQMVFSNGAKGQPLVRMVRDGHDLTFDVPFDLPVPVLSDSTLQYPNVAPGVDLLVTVDPDGSGFSEVLRVASPAAAADPRIADLAFPITVSPDLALTAASDGGLTAADGAGDAVFTSPVPQMWDSRTDNQTPTVSANFATTGPDSVTDFGLSQGLQANRAARVHGPLSVDRSSNLKSKLAPGKVKVTPDAGMLSDPQTVWPVYIDPSIRAGWPGDRIAVADVGNKTWNFVGDEGMGRCGTTGSPMYCSRVFTERLVWQFYGLSVIAGSTVSQANLSVNGVHSYSCTPYPVEAWWTGGITSASTFQSISWLALLSSQSLSHKAACNNQRWIAFDVTGGARQTAAQRANQLTVGLKATDETSSTGWKRYGYDAALDVWYDNPPNTPTALQLVDGTVTKACGSVVKTSMPTMVATVHDPDGDSPNMRVDITDTRTGGTQRVAGPTQANDTQWRLPPNIALGDDPYTFTATAGDGVLLSGTSAPCAFTVDTTAPTVAPGVSFDAAKGVVYTEKQTSGGVDQPGQFTFTNGGVPDVVSYNYGVDNSAMPNSWTPGQAAVVFPATLAGPHTIYVQSVDRAGWLSPREDYSFSVAGVQSSGLWLFDDAATSLTAADSIGNHPLTLSSTTLKADGVIKELDSQNAAPGDASVHLQTAADRVTSSVPLVRTDSTFSVGAFVKLDDLTGVQTVASQDGLNASGFELGYRSGTGSGCPTSDGCWAFTMNGTDDATTPTPTTVTSSQTVVKGQWAYLTGAYNATLNQMSLYVCSPPGEAPDAPVTASFTASWFATGVLAVGRGQVAAAPSHSLRGYVDDVRVSTGIPDTDALTRYCSGNTGL